MEERFVDQAYTDRLPRVFEINGADDERMKQRDETGRC
jgi:hypothetical protein